MNDFTPDIETIITKRKQEWMREAQKRVSIQERVALSVPWWLIIVAASIFALSAAHTAGVFFQLSSVGGVAPFAVEFALLWAAFGRVSLTGRMSMAVRSLEVLAFIMAVLANGIGAVERVAEIAKINNQSIAQIIEQYGSLPIGTQATLFFVPLFALFIPIGTWVAGEGLAKLFLQQRASGTLLDQRWREVEVIEVYRVLYQVYIQRGTRPVEARKTAMQIAQGMQVKALPSFVPSVPAEQDSGGDAPVQRGRTKKEIARDLLASHPEWASLSLRDLQDRTGINKNIWAEVKPREDDR